MEIKQHNVLILVFCTNELVRTSTLMLCPCLIVLNNCNFKANSSCIQVQVIIESTMYINVWHISVVLSVALHQ